MILSQPSDEKKKDPPAPKCLNKPNVSERPRRKQYDAPRAMMSLKKIAKEVG
jgi:hypothetical protein